jgi:hypothetical protein
LKSELKEVRRDIKQRKIIQSFFDNVGGVLIIISFVLATFFLLLGVLMLLNAMFWQDYTVGTAMLNLLGLIFCLAIFLIGLALSGIASTMENLTTDKTLKEKNLATRIDNIQMDYLQEQMEEMSKKHEQEIADTQNRYEFILKSLAEKAGKVSEEMESCKKIEQELRKEIGAVQGQKLCTKCNMETSHLNEMGKWRCFKCGHVYLS